MAIVRADGSEIVQYTCKNIPVYVKYGRLSYYPRRSEIAHWHNDLELLVILDGEMNFNVDGNIVKLKKNSGIFVNSKHIHYGFSEENRECAWVCMLIDAERLYPQGDFQAEHIQPLLDSLTEPFALLEMKDAEGNILMEIIDLYNHLKEEDFPLLALGGSVKILHWLRAALARKQGSGKSGQALGSIKSMLRFIQENYAEPVTLADIARAGNVCKSGCSATFNEVLHRSPVDFLIEYRLNKARELLSDTDRSVSEVATMVGFSSMSYFTERFKRTYGMTPREMRKKL